MDEFPSESNGEQPPSVDRPDLVGDVVFGSRDSPVAVCTLASRALLPLLAGRPEVAVAGRVYTENVGIERMVQNLLRLPTVRFLLVCGRETRHHVGQTILALHRSGLDGDGRVIGSDAPEPLMPNLQADELRRFQQDIVVVDLIGETSADVIIARAAELATTVDAMPAAPAAPPAAAAVEHVMATRDPASAWVYDPMGYFLIFVDTAHAMLRIEHYDQRHRLHRVVWGQAAPEIHQTIVRLGLVTLLEHAAYLGRELGRAESAMRLGLPYDQDRPLAMPAPSNGAGDDDAGQSPQAPAY